MRLLTRPPSAAPLPEVPTSPTALLDAVNSHRLGLGLEPALGPLPGARTQALAAVPQPYAGRVAALLQVIGACAPTGGLACATATHDALVAVLRTPAPAFPDIDLWPRLYIDGNGGPNTYRHDYVVLIDRGGNDTYDNNAGGNLVDVRRGPAGFGAPVTGPAIGCEQATGVSSTPTNNVFDCVSLPQVALLDHGAFGTSNDTCGVLRAPRTVDHNPQPLPDGSARPVDGDCTRDPVVFRIVLQGSGFEGNGLLVDVDGNDRYRGKTAAQGSAHVSGVGVMRDLGRGTDDYLAIRNSQGFALAGGLGLLMDQDGRDTDTGAPTSTQPFTEDVRFVHSSQGVGCSGGAGVPRDTGRDDDTYREGSRRDDGMSDSRLQTQCEPGAPGLSVFSDDGR